MDAVVLAASIAEAMGALLVAAVAAGCLHAYPRPHLKPWAWSWLAGAAAVALTVFASSALPLSHPTGPAAGIANLALRCVQIASFMIGARAFAHGTPLTPARQRDLCLGVAAFGLTSAVLHLSSGSWLPLLRSLWLTAALAGVFVWGGLISWRAAQPTVSVVGSRVVAGALVAYGASTLVRAPQGQEWPLGHASLPSVLLGFADFALLAVLALGLVVALLEDERRTGARADATHRSREAELETERDRLRASEEIFEKVFRSSPDAITLTSPSEGGRIIDVNEGFERMTGYSAAEVIGRTTLDLNLFVNPDDRQRILAAVADGAVRDEELQLRTRSGETRTCLVSGGLIQVAGKQYAVGVTRDVTEVRRAERQLRESEERLLRALEAAQMGTWEWDIGTGAVSHMGQAEALLGFPPGTFPGTIEAFKQAVHPDDRRIVEDALAAAISGENRGLTQFRVLTDPPRWLEGKGQIFRNAAGHPVLMRGTLTDVTERKRAETELRESEERWRRISEATFEGIGISQDGMLADLNPQLAEMLGYTAPELIGRPVVDLVAPEDRSKVVNSMRSGNTKAYEHLAVRRDGSTLLVETRARTLTRHGRQIRVTAVRDVSERARLETELRRRETLAAMGSLVAGVAHEVRTPLFSLSATLDALEAGAGSADQQRELKDLLRSQVRRLSNLMQDLLDYGRPPKLKRTRTAIREAVQRAARSCGALTAQSGVGLDLDLPDGLPEVDADVGRLEQVFENLLANAVQHAPRRSTVRLTARPATGLRSGVTCAIEDEGPGLAPSDFERVFEPFFSRRKGGTGMGLAIAHRLVEAHGGSLTAGNRTVAGAVFTVFLPAARESRAGDAVA